MRRIYFYDRKHDLYEAAFITRCYTQHALRPNIDSEINHIRQFIKILLINKVIEFIDVLEYFEIIMLYIIYTFILRKHESPIICYKYNKPIRNIIYAQFQ